MGCLCVVCATKWRQSTISLSVFLRNMSGAVLERRLVFRGSQFQSRIFFLGDYLGG